MKEIYFLAAGIWALMIGFALSPKDVKSSIIGIRPGDVMRECVGKILFKDTTNKALEGDA